MERLPLSTAAALALASAGSRADLQAGRDASKSRGRRSINYGVLTIDQATGLGYLADKDNKAVVVFDTKTDKFVPHRRLCRHGQERQRVGPEWCRLVGGGAELWVSDGDFTIKVVDLKSNVDHGDDRHRRQARANAMAFDPNSKVVIVANSNDELPFLSLISAEPGHKILAKLPVAASAENLERSA